MITQEVVVQSILAYLNGQFDLPTLVHCAEDALFNLSESDVEVPNEAALMDILGYIGAGDTPYFPLTWDVVTKFLEQLGAKAHVTVESL